MSWYDLALYHYKRSILRDSGSKVKKLINVANIEQSKIFKPLILET